MARLVIRGEIRPASKGDNVKLEDGNNEGYIHAPENNPYKTVKLMVPATSFTARVQNTRTPEMAIHGIMALNTPIRWTKKLGITRPMTLAPFRIAI